jgi:hypothetical protein
MKKGLADAYLLTLINVGGGRSLERTALPFEFPVSGTFTGNLSEIRRLGDPAASAKSSPGTVYRPVEHFFVAKGAGNF